MNLASKDYVDNLVASRMPDWNNAVNITFTQINQGYTFDNDGFFVLTGRGGKNAEAWVTINNVKVSFYSTYGQQIDAQIQTMVNRGDIVKSPHELKSNFTASFIPFKSMD